MTNVYLDEYDTRIIESEIAQVMRAPRSYEHAVQMLIADYRGKVEIVLEQETPCVVTYLRLKRFIAYLVTREY